MFLWVLGFDTAFISEYYKNEIIKVFSEDINMLGPVFANYIGFFIEIIFTIFIGLFVSFYFDWRISLISVFLFFCLFFILYKYSDEESLSEEEIIEDDFFSDTITNIKLIKAYDLKENLLKFIFNAEENIKTKNSNYNNFTHFLFYGVYEFSVSIVIALIILTGGYFIIIVKVSTLASFLGSTSNLFFFLELMHEILEYLWDVLMIKDCLENIKYILKRKNFIKNKINSGENKNIDIDPEILGRLSDNTVKGKIEFRNVSFRYSKKNTEKVLDNISFVISPGMKVGFVGSSGSGKSTIIQLLLGFYEIEEGEILIDDINIQNYEKKILRNLISGVFQEPELFEMSILDNIKYGNLSANNDELEKAVEIACVPKKLLDEKFPREISQISGGQKQRIALARCLMKERNIMFFDEATSALDLKMDDKINENLRKYFKKDNKKKTVLIVAHRLYY